MENQLELPILGHSSHLYIEESSGTSEHSGGYSPPPRWVGESDTKRYGHLYRYYRYYWQEGDSGSRRTRWRHIPGGRVGTALGDARAEAVRGRSPLGCTMRILSGCWCNGMRAEGRITAKCLSDLCSEARGLGHI
ncbi:MAG: hypothetical protein HC878_03580 [Leptolyngbyaceae cyanobacterium SL_5_14]|nr:hypothetical protein [Leptolyngbyaceae cyanobacterium SL_5_14]